MPAYWIANIEITDPAGRGGGSEVLEGTWVPKRQVVIEFPGVASLRSWNDSPAHRPPVDLRS